jgi:hypothetical protein
MPVRRVHALDQRDALPGPVKAPVPGGNQRPRVAGSVASLRGSRNVLSRATTRTRHASSPTSVSGMTNKSTMSAIRRKWVRFSATTTLFPPKKLREHKRRHASS